MKYARVISMRTGQLVTPDTARDQHVTGDRYLCLDSYKYLRLHISALGLIADHFEHEPRWGVKERPNA